MPSEGVMLTRIAIDCRVWFAGKCLLDLSLRRLGNELVLLGQGHQQRRIKTVDLAQIFLSVTAMISDRGVDAVARSRQEGHQATETKAHDGNLPTAVRELGHRVGSILNVSGAGVPVISLVEAKAVLPVGLGGDPKVDTRLLTPEQVGRDRNQALFRQFIAGLADVGVHPEQLLQNDNGGSRQGLRPRDIGAKRAVPAFYGDAILHWVLLKRRHSSGPPPDVVRIGGGPLSSEAGSAWRP